jgi:hypothetical protein
MSTPVLNSVAKIETSQIVEKHSLHVSSPEWAATPRDEIKARYRIRGWLAAALAVVAIALMAVSTWAPLPGEKATVGADKILAPALDSVKAANKEYTAAVGQAAGARSILRDARLSLKDAKVALRKAQRVGANKMSAKKVKAAKKAKTAKRAKAARLRHGVAIASRALDRKRAVVTAVAAERATALELVDKATNPPPTSDADLVRSVALALAGLAAVLGAIALIVPRPSPPLTFATGNPVGTNTHSVGGGGGGDGAGAGKDISPEGVRNPIPPVHSDDLTSAPKVEPALTQGIALAVITGLGVFGINATGGAQEQVINLLLPLAPIVGAFFVRRRVTPMAKLQSGETRLPGGLATSLRN